MVFGLVTFGFAGCSGGSDTDTQTTITNASSTSTTEALAKLGDALKIPERPRFHADSIAQEVAHMEEGDRPSRYDLPLLRKIIGERLKEAHARRLEQEGEGE